MALRPGVAALARPCAILTSVDGKGRQTGTARTPPSSHRSRGALSRKAAPDRPQPRRGHAQPPGRLPLHCALHQWIRDCFVGSVGPTRAEPLRMEMACPCGGPRSRARSRRPISQPDATCMIAVGWPFCSMNGRSGGDTGRRPWRAMLDRPRRGRDAHAVKIDDDPAADYGCPAPFGAGWGFTGSRVGRCRMPRPPMHLRTQRDPGVADIRDTGSPHGRPWLGIAPASGSHSRMFGTTALHKPAVRDRHGLGLRQGAEQTLEPIPDTLRIRQRRAPGRRRGTLARIASVFSSQWQ